MSSLQNNTKERKRGEKEYPGIEQALTQNQRGKEGEARRANFSAAKGKMGGYMSLRGKTRRAKRDRQGGIDL